MKTIWTALSIIAVANLVALIALAGWLKSSDRLDGTRVQQIRQVFGKTLSQQRAEEAEAQAKAEAEKKAAEEKAKQGQPPVRAGDQVEVRLREAQADLVRLDGVRRDVQVLRDTLARERRALDEDRKKFDEERAAWAKKREDETKLVGDEQFKRTLTTLEGLKADKAKSTLDELIRVGKTDQVIAYLDAMQDRTRTKVIDEFVKADPKLAADLLERLRTRGQVGPAAAAAPK